MNYLHYLTDCSGFPVITRYGKSWETWLIVVFIVSKLFTGAAYTGMLYTFTRILGVIHANGVDAARAASHVPLVIKFYAISVLLSLLLTIGQAVAFWYPALRALGLLALVESCTLLIASIGTYWAYRRSIVRTSKCGVS